jgi:hypothetical protein
LFCFLGQDLSFFKGYVHYYCCCAGGTLWHLQKFLQYIINEFTPSIILLCPLSRHFWNSFNSPSWVSSLWSSCLRLWSAEIESAFLLLERPKWIFLNPNVSGNWSYLFFSSKEWERNSLHTRLRVSSENK